MLDALGLNLIEVVDRLPELVDGFVEDVRGIDACAFLELRLAELLELGRRCLRIRHSLTCASETSASGSAAWPHSRLAS